MKAYLTLRRGGSWVICEASELGARRSFEKYGEKEDGTLDYNKPVYLHRRWVPNETYTPEYHGQVIHLYNAPGKAKSRAGKHGKVAEVDLEAQIPMDASAQEKLEHYERLMLKYGALMDALRQELLDGR